MIKAILNVFNRTQAESKRELAREERRWRSLIKDLEKETGLGAVLDKIETTKRDWEKEDRRNDSIISFLDL